MDMRGVGPLDNTTIGVLSPVTGGFYYGRVLSGINRELRAVGGRIVFVQTLDAGLSGDEVFEAPDFHTPVAWDHLDGVISIATGTQRGYLDDLLAHGIPVALASDVVDGLDAPAAVPDNAGGIAAAVEHLLSHGHTRIGFVANLVQSDMRERYAAYREALAAHGIDPDADWLFEASDNSEAGGAAAGRLLLAADVPVTALVCATDRTALGCIGVLREAGVRVPDDVAVTGFDGIEAARYSTPTLTTVHHQFDELGAAAARLLLARIAGEEVAPGAHPIPGELRLRESCGCAGLDQLAENDPSAAIAHWRGEAEQFLHRGEQRERWMREQYEIGIRLLDHDRPAPQHLEWLEATGVHAAELALWEGDPACKMLQVVGAYDRAGVANSSLGWVVPVTGFPTAELLARSDAHPEAVTIVVPVAARGQNFGLLAVVSEVDTMSANGRATHNQWAAMLTTALDQQLLHDRLRTSEERYSLWALATDDGLWDWDLGTGAIYYSGRCMEMLGHDYRSVTGPPSIWLDRVHPEDQDRMRRVMRGAATLSRATFEIEHRVHRGDGEYRRVLLRALPVGPEGEPAIRLVGSMHDVEERRRLEEQLRHRALYDDVTGLPNRRLFLERLEVALDRERGRGRGFAVAFFDLDGFKAVNDSLGHLAGDRLLAEVGDRLRRRMRRADVAARFGGDEFAVLLHDTTPVAALAAVANLQADIFQPVDLDGRSVTVSASVGVTTSQMAYVTPDEVIRDADLAMYRAKATLPGSVLLFDESLRDELGALSAVLAERRG